jgi:hypothetical protein
MRAFHAVVFDDVVQNTTPVYTDAEHNALLGSADKMTFQVIANVLDGGPDLTVTVQHAPDDRTWIQRGGEAEIPGASLSVTDTNSLVRSYDSGGTAGCRVRFRVELSESGIVRVKIIACGRSLMRNLEGAEDAGQGGGCGCGSAESKKLVITRNSMGRLVWKHGPGQSRVERNIHAQLLRTVYFDEDL